MDLNKKVGELKQIVFEKTKVPIERLKFNLNERELDNDYSFKSIPEIDPFKEKVVINISGKQLNDVIYLQYPNSEIKECHTDLYNTGLELLKQIDNYTSDDNAHFKININYSIKIKCWF